LTFDFEALVQLVAGIGDERIAGRLTLDRAMGSMADLAVFIGCAFIS
jgi:hypothetical protein